MTVRPIRRAIQVRIAEIMVTLLVVAAEEGIRYWLRRKNLVTDDQPDQGMLNIE